MSGNDSFTKLLLHCDGTNGSTTFTDASIGGAHGNATVNGGAVVDTAQSEFGGASLHSGQSSGFLSYASNADWNLGAAAGGDFTIDFWVRFNSISGTANGLSCATDGSTGFQFYATTSSLRVWNGPGTDRGLAWTPSTATWYHVALVRSGSTVGMYINGSSLGTVTDNDFNNDSNSLLVGAHTSGGSFLTDGWFDEVRWSKGIARWTSNFTPPTAAYDAGSSQVPYTPYTQLGPILAQRDRLRSLWNGWRRRQSGLLTPAWSM